MDDISTRSEATGRQDRDAQRLLRAGAWSALAVAVGYVIIVALYARVGAPPSGGQAWLAYGAGRTGTWWGIAALSVVTDLLYLPVALALYRVLKQAGRYLALSGSGLLAGFVGLDLVVTWPNYAALISLSGSYAGTTDGARRAGDVAAADYASAVLSGRLEAFYSIAVPAVGILIIGVLALRGPLGRATALLGVAVGVLGLVATAGPALTSALDAAVILTSVGTTVWFLLLARDLHRLGHG
jgi:hypothetical protein